MNLSEKPTIVHFPETHYIFVDKVGPFQDTARDCWQQIHAAKEQIAASASIKSSFSTYQFEPDMLYRAGFALDKKPERMIPGLRYELFSGGRYACFTLKGSYDQLPEACGLVFERAEEQGIEFRDGFFVEHYVNNPETTAEENLITEILLPI